MNNGRWTAEEYREYLRTGREPARRSAVSPSRCQPARPSGVTLDEETVSPEDRPKKPRKYRNEPVTLDGIRFDSKHEAAVYQELMFRVKSGELRNVLLQVPFILPGGIRYVADFVTLTPDFRIEGVYDAKSEITRKNRVYINKRKQMKACWGIEIKEV